MDHGFGATNHITLHRVVFDTYEVIAPHNVHLGDESVVKVIGMRSIAVKAIVRVKSTCTLLHHLLKLYVDLKNIYMLP